MAYEKRKEDRIPGSVYKASLMRPVEKEMINVIRTMAKDKKVSFEELSTTINAYIKVYRQYVGADSDDLKKIQVMPREEIAAWVH